MVKKSGPATKKTKKTKARKKPVLKEEILREEIDKIVGSRTFGRGNSQSGNRLIRLRIVGEKIIGHLGWPIANWREGTSYPIQLESGEIVEIVGNRLLHKMIDKGDLCGQKVEIVYEGKDYIPGWHARKVYRIYKYEEPGMTQKEFEKLLTAAKKERNQDE